MAVSGKAKYFGIPAATITWTGPSTTQRTLTIYTSVRKSMSGDVAMTNDNDGERVGSRRINNRITASFSAHPAGADAAAALAIGADLPYINTLCTVACTGDDQLDTPAGGCSIVDSVEASYTPEGELSVDFTVTHWIGKVFAAV